MEDDICVQTHVSVLGHFTNVLSIRKDSVIMHEPILCELEVLSHKSLVQVRINLQQVEHWQQPYGTMDVKVASFVQGKLLPPTTFGQQQGPRLNIRRVFSYIALFSIAITLSSLLPTPWSILPSTETSKVTFNVSSVDPADEWQDNVYPLRAQTPWDISTDYSYPRTLEYDVQEGTWLRLDVHPTSGDVVFDMVGDLYCLPGSQALQSRSTSSLIKARPILLGIPYDSEPHFSPSGDRLVFKSDAELGVENIWVMEWKGCEQMDVRALEGSTEDLRVALGQQAVEEKLLAQGVAEEPHRKTNRLIREGRLHSKTQV